MTRSASPIVVALAVACFGLCDATGARAQMSPSDEVTRLDRLESAIRNLTGTVEELQYHNQQLQQQVQRLQEQIESGGRAPQAGPAAEPQRPPSRSMSQPYPASAAQYPPPAASPYPPPSASSYPPPAVAAATPAPIAAEPSSGRRGDAFDPALNPTAPGAPHPLGAPGVVEPPPPVAERDPRLRQAGTPLDIAGSEPAGGLPPPPPTNTSGTGAVLASLPPPSTPREQYELGQSYVQRRDYASAADAFRDFLKKYPSDRLTPEAQYWLGESLFQTQHYRDAAESFLAVSTKYENTARAPDALLRLGQSLAALGEKEAACASLGEVLRKYPRASLNVKQNVEREQKRAHC